MTTTGSLLDTQDLKIRVKEMYRDVADHPDKQFHFETGRPLAERLGYPVEELDAIPAEAIASFAGVGYYFDLAEPSPGETAVDLGSGSGMDSFFTARKVGERGRVIGVDMTDAQLTKAERLGREAGLSNVEFRNGYIEQIQLPEGVTCDASLWAACIGGAMQRDEYDVAIESAGFTIDTRRENDRYRFLSERAVNATEKYGVKSVSILARKTG